MMLLLFCVFVLSIIIAVAWQRKKLSNFLPPGPPALPLIGNLLQFDTDDIRKTFLKWHKIYGPVYTVWFGITPNVFVTDYDLMQELFVRRGDEFAFRPESFLFGLFAKGRRGIINTDGEMWKEQRRFSLHTLRNFGFGKRTMEEKINVELGKLLDKISDHALSAKTFDLKPLLNICVSNVISSVILGVSYEQEHPSFVKLNDALEENIKLFSMFRIRLLNNLPWLRFVPLFQRFGYTTLKKNVDDFYDILNVELEKRKLQVEKEIKDENFEAADFVSSYWQEIRRKQNTGENAGYFTDRQLMSICGDIWIAGIVTTVVTLYWGLLLMGHHPEVQQKVQQEIDSIIGQARPPNMSDRNQMPYTTAVLHEIQRYANIFTTNIRHTVGRDTTVLNYIIPKGVGVVPQISVVHYDENNFENPSKFDPTRFLESNATTLKNTDRVMPFSLGKRQCLGESLARMELFLIFVSLLQKFSFVFPADKSKPSLKPLIGFNAIPMSYEVCTIQRYDCKS